MHKRLISPFLSLTLGYGYILIISFIFYNIGLYNDNQYFNWGPPVFIFQKKIDTQYGYYLIHVLIFCHQCINNWINSVVYPWIINQVQNTNCKKMDYGLATSLILINCFDLYSELDLMFIIIGLSTQISFLLTLTLSNMIVNTVINWRYILDKEEISEYSVLDIV